MFLMIIENTEKAINIMQNLIYITLAWIIFYLHYKTWSKYRTFGSVLWFCTTLRQQDPSLCKNTVSCTLATSEIIGSLNKENMLRKFELNVLGSKCIKSTFTNLPAELVNTTWFQSYYTPKMVDNHNSKRLFYVIDDKWANKYKMFL